MTETVPAELVAFAAALADASGAVVRRYFRQKFDIVTKPDQSPVTIADREAETAIRKLVAARYPTHGVIGEEHDDHQTDAEWVWVLDPIDGTKGFISGRPLFGTLIALCRGGRPVLGVIDHPALGERWVGANGHPARFNGKEVRVRPCADIAQASLFASSPHMFHGPAAPAFERLRRRCRQVLYGSDCYHYGILASGFGDLVAESNMGIYDYLAAVPVIGGAGGVVTDWQGRPPTISSGDQVLAAGDRRMHEAALKLLAG
jgi:inositol-phosphate phosphatase/L-galactose 1-phosphate phosphatase/histidinol-phosphatase